MPAGDKPPPYAVMIGGGQASTLRGNAGGGQAPTLRQEGDTNNGESHGGSEYIEGHDKDRSL